MLKNDDIKYWGVLPEVYVYISSLIKDGDKVLDVGPGGVPFEKATHFIDNQPRDYGENCIVLDVETNKLPYPDKFFDFIYCRHIVEDLLYPFEFLKELSRVGKAGYIETPSVISEMCRGINGNEQPWRGYIHHHWFVWNNNGKLSLLKKFPYIEHIPFNDQGFTTILLEHPRQWNTYYLWTDIVEFEEVRLSEFLPQFPDAIIKAAVQGTESTNKFMTQVDSVVVRISPR